MIFFYRFDYTREINLIICFHECQINSQNKNKKKRFISTMFQLNHKITQHYLYDCSTSLKTNFIKT